MHSCSSYATDVAVKGLCVLTALGQGLTQDQSFVTPPVSPRTSGRETESPSAAATRPLTIHLSYPSHPDHNSSKEKQTETVPC